MPWIKKKRKKNVFYIYAANTYRCWCFFVLTAKIPSYFFNFRFYIYSSFLVFKAFLRVSMHPHAEINIASPFLSVCPSVCPRSAGIEFKRIHLGLSSVTLVFKHFDRGIILLFSTPCPNKFQQERLGARNTRRVAKIYDFRPKLPFISETARWIILLTKNEKKLKICNFPLLRFSVI